MIPLSAKELLPFTPVEGGTTYQLAVPTMMQRAAYRRDINATGARYVQDTDLLNLLREGIRAVVEEDAQPALQEIVDSYESVSQDPEKLAEDTGLLKDIADIENVISKHYPAYAEAQADRTYWLSVAPYVAFRHFVRGWEGSDVVYEARAGRVTEACMEQLTENDILIVGWKILGLMNPTQEQKKNSESRSPSPSDRETLPAA